MANKKPLMTLIDLLVSILVMVALVNWGTVYWFNFNIVETVFRFNWLIGTVYTIVSVVGLIWVISALTRLVMK